MRKGLLVIVFLFLSLYVVGQTCTLNVNLSSSNPSICSGTAVVLTAAASGGTSYSYVWSTGETTPTISVNKAGVYKVSVTEKNSSCPAISKSITITTATVPDAPTANGTSVCVNSSATLTATAPGGTYQWFDNAGNFLFTGNPFTTPAITNATTYYVQTTIDGCTSQRTPVTVNLFAKPSVTKATVCAGNSATLSASGGDSYQWYASSSGGNILSTDASFMTPPLLNTTTYYVVAIVNGCASARTPVTATVSPPPQKPVATSPTVCYGSAANLHADAPAGLFDWFDVPVGGTSLITSPDYTTPSLTKTTTYYVQNSLNGCTSARTAVTVTVNQIPQAPAVAPVSVCPGTSATLAVTSPTDTYQWYDSLSGGTLLHIGNTYTTPVLNASTTYYVQTVSGGCTSDSRTAVRVTVNPPPPAPSASGVIICPGNIATLTAIFPGGTYQWYDAASAGNLLFTGDSYTTLPLSVTTTFYLQTTIAGCTSARTPVTVTVLPSPAPPTASNASVCYGNSATLTASGGSDEGYEWYDKATGGILLLISQVYVSPALTANTTYYVQTTSASGCISARTPVTVTVNPTPTAPKVNNGAAVCPGTPVTLTASVPSGTIEWYDAANGGKLLTTGSSYITPPLTQSTTYYVQNVSGSCVSSRTPVTASVIPEKNPAFQYGLGTFCIFGSNPKPVINDPAGGTFSVTPAGLVFVDPHTGEVNISASTVGFYVVSFTSNDACATVTSANVAVVSKPGTDFSYGGPFCQDDVNPLPYYSAGASGGTFTASPTGLVFRNTSTGEIDLSASQPGTYTVTNTTTASGACTSSVSTAKVTIYKKATVDAGPDQTVKAGDPVQLAGSGSPGVKWSGGAGSFSNTSDPTAVYTPAAGEKAVTLTLTTSDPPGPCGPKSASVTITITPPPVTPIAPGTSVCMGSSANLSALGPGGTYRWYSASTSGTLLAVGAVYTTPILTVTTTYYVQTTINGITSARTAVTVTVNSPPPPPVAPGVPTCSGSSTLLTASGSAGGYEWYDAPIGGHLLSASNTYTTPALTVNTSYFVQTTVNGCVSARTQVDVQVNPVPTVTSHPTDDICSNNPLNYTITADMPGATFTWSRAAVTGISNPVVSNQTTGTITESLINTGTTNIHVTYVIIPLLNDCAGSPFNYVVTVYPSSSVTSNLSATVCNMTASNYTIAFNTSGTSAKWSRATVPGISNSAVSGQAAPVIREVLFNTTNAPIDVPYIFTYGTKACSGFTTTVVITVNPSVNITSSPADPVCSGTPENYVITSNVSSATFSWSRDAVSNISNPAVSDQTSPTIKETLVNTSTRAVKVIYMITPTANGCPDDPFTYTVTVNPQPPTPVANSNSPVCSGNTIQLKTPTVSKATYLWTGPNGFSSPLQNPDIENATTKYAGTYNLYVTLNGCTSDAGSVVVAVDAPPTVDVGKTNVNVCALAPQVQLAGKIGGGTSTGIWSTEGTGTFSPANSPTTNDLNAVYTPSQKDIDAGSVVIHLTSTSKDDCSPAVGHVTITFKPSPAVNAGPNQDVCSQDPAVKLAGKLLISGGVIWKSSGTGTFIPSATQQDASYVPSAADLKAGTVTLTIRATSAGPCDIDNDKIVINFIPPPTVDAGGTRYVLKGNKIILNPTVSDRNVQYLWTPDIDINDNTARNPEITGDVDRTYTLTVTDSRGCVSTDQTFIKVSPTIVVPNTFTPNGDGINDQWNIVGLIAYPAATVDIFDRYGQKVFHSLSYPKAWDGTYNGKQLPVGTYYYVINTNLNGVVFSGYIVIVR